MAVSMIQKIAENLNCSSLHKVDPNIDELPDKSALSAEELVMRAGIPTVAAALYKYGLTERGAKVLLFGQSSTNWMKDFLGDKADLAVHKVADYSGESTDTTAYQLQKIAATGVSVLRKMMPDDATDQHLFDYLGNQRHDILSHLPAAMKMGELWNDDVLDDRTNKMEGPISSLMHSIENKLSSPSR